MKDTNTRLHILKSCVDEVKEELAEVTDRLRLVEEELLAAMKKHLSSFEGVEFIQDIIRFEDGYIDKWLGFTVVSLGVYDERLVPLDKLDVFLEGDESILETCDTAD